MQSTKVRGFNIMMLRSANRTRQWSSKAGYAKCLPTMIPSLRTSTFMLPVQTRQNSMSILTRADAGRKKKCKYM